MLFAELGKFRSTCLQIPGTHNFQNLCLGTRSLGVRCLFTELGEADRSVCVSTFRSNSGLPVKSAEGRSINFVDLTTLAGSAVVPNADLHCMRHPSGLEGEPGASGLQRAGFSGVVVELFVGKIRANTARPARTIVPGEIGQIGVWEGVQIPCLMI
jgi:hypothetical protein